MMPVNVLSGKVALTADVLLPMNFFRIIWFKTNKAEGIKKSYVFTLLQYFVSS